MAPVYLQPSVAITNSFGMPSMDREFLLGDIPRAAAALGPGQVGSLTAVSRVLAVLLLCLVLGVAAVFEGGQFCAWVPRGTAQL